jgi:hypothetical protein
VIPGLAKDDPEVVTANKKFTARRKKIKKLKIMRTFLKAMMVMNMTWQVLDACDISSSSSRTTAAAAVAAEDDDSPSPSLP